MQDEAGWIWLVTETGLDRYDGFSFRAIMIKGLDLPLQQVHYLYEDKVPGKILAATGKGIFVIDSNTLSAELIIDNLLDILFIDRCVDGQLSLFSSTKVHIYHYDHGLDEPISLDGEFIRSVQKAIIQKEPHYLMLPRFDDDAILIMKEGDWREIERWHPIEVKERPTSLYQNGDTLFIGTESFTIYKYNIHTRQHLLTIKRRYTDLTSKQNSVETLWQDQNGMLWIGTKETGLYIFSPGNYKQTEDKYPFELHTNGSWKAFLHPRKCQAINSRTIHCITASADGVIWVGTESGGINLYQPTKQQFVKYLSGSVVNNGITSVFDNRTEALSFVEEGRLLAGTDEDKVIDINTNSGTTRRWTVPCIDTTIQSINVIAPTSEGDYLLGTDNGVFLIEDSSSCYKKEGFHSFEVSALAFDARTAYIWTAIPVLKKVFIRKKGNKADIDAFSMDPKITFIKRKSRDSIFWIGTEKGLYHAIVNNYDHPISPVLVPRIPPELSFTNLDFSLNENYFWLSSESGAIFKYDASRNEIVQEFKSKTISKIRAIAEDIDGKVWYSTNSGIYSLNPKDSTYNHYTYEDGLQSNEFNTRSVAYNDDRSQLFFGGINGVNGLHPIRIRDTTHKKTYLKYLYRRKSRDVEKMIPLIEETSVAIKLPNEFQHLDLQVYLVDYNDPSNNKLRISINNEQEYQFFSDGKFTLTTDKLKYFPWQRNLLRIEYRSPHGEWKVLPNIFLTRAIFSPKDQLLAALIIVIGVLMLLLRNARLNFSIWRQFPDIVECINDISRLENTKDICRLSVSHFVHTFKYDFALIALIDVKENRIRTEYYKTADKTQDDPGRWKHLSDYDMDRDKDILVQVAQLKEVIKVNGKTILNNSIKDPENALNKAIFTPHAHIKHITIHTPIIHRSLNHYYGGETPIEEDFVIGVISVGRERKKRLWSSIWEKIAWLKFKWGGGKNAENDLELTRLKLYTDNFAQSYFRAFFKEMKENLVQDAIKANSEQIEDHRAFMKAVLKNLKGALGVDYGIVSLRSIKYANLTVTENDLQDGYTDGQWRIGCQKFKLNQEKGIVRRVFENQQPYYSNDITKDKYYLNILDSIKSEMALPMINEDGNAIGVFCLSSKRLQHFNSVTVELANEIVKESIPFFLNKKRYNSLKELTQPYEIFVQNQSHLYRYAIDSLRKYFDGEDISVWVRQSPYESTFELFGEVASPKLQKRHREFNFSNFRLRENDPGGYPDPGKEKAVRLRQIDYDGMEQKYNRLYRLCKKNGYQSYVLLVIAIEQKFEAFIYVLSKRKIKMLSALSTQLLEQIAKKTALGVQGIQLTESFNEISRSLSNSKTQQTVEVIVEQALKVLKADSVTLFRYPNDTIRMEHATSRGVFSPEMLKPETTANLANWVIHGESIYFDDAEKYLSWYNTKAQSKHELKQTFWGIHSLQSMAAIKLQHEGRPLGVMIFNYKFKKDFNAKGGRRIIEAFTKLATIALLNKDYIKQIHREIENLGIERKQLVVENRKLDKQRAEIKFDYEHVYQKMEEMMPRATRTSFWLILQGINHDIRNFLIDTQAIIFKLEDENANLPSSSKKLLKSSLRRLENNIDKIGNLLELFNFRDDHKKDFIDVHETLRLVSEFYESTENKVKITYEASTEIPHLYGNRAEFSMIIYNLISNAAAAIKATGTKHGRITVDAKLSNKDYLITVEDTGIGIAKEVFERIFDYGYSSRSSMGIGLYYVKETIEKEYQGKVRVVSTVGKGSIFQITIPKSINDMSKKKAKEKT